MGMARGNGRTDETITTFDISKIQVQMIIFPVGGAFYWGSRSMVNDSSVGFFFQRAYKAQGGEFRTANAKQLTE